MQNISTILSQFNPLLDFMIEVEPARVQLKEALKSLEFAVKLIESKKSAEYHAFCSEKLQQLKVKHSEISGAALSSEALSDVIEAICDLSLKLFGMMRKPGSPSDLDIGSSLAHSVFRLNQESSAIYRAFSEWISIHNIPVADLNWKREELLRLAPHLAVVNLTDYSERETGLPIQVFLSACASAKTLIFFRNEITEPLKGAIRSLETVEEIQFKLCKITGEPDFSSCRSLKRFLLQESTFGSPALDFGSYPSLQSLSIVGLPKFNGAIVMPVSGSFRELRLDHLPEFNAELDFAPAPFLEHLYLNLLRSMNQPLNLSPLSKLETLEIKCCDAWEAPLTLPASCPLKTLDLSDDRKFKEDLSPIKNFVSLEKIALTNCRKLERDIDFSKLVNLKHISLRNCLSYSGPVNCAQASSLQVLDVANCKKIGPVDAPFHLQ